MTQGFIVAQISDSHLFADKGVLFHGHNVYQNLYHILKAIKSDFVVDAIVFSGDLTQDDTPESYQNFVQAVNDAGITKPIYFLAGNHDDTKLLESELQGPLFHHDKVIASENWKLHLLNSKSQTPSGNLSSETLANLAAYHNEKAHQFIFMHHNPINVNMFIDKYALENKAEFWAVAKKMTSLKGVGCGHVHRELTIKSHHDINTVPLYACPATSIQFDPIEDGVSALDERPGYRRFIFFASGEIQTDVFRV